MTSLLGELADGLRLELIGRAAEAAGQGCADGALSVWEGDEPRTRLARVSF